VIHIVVSKEWWHWCERFGLGFDPFLETLTLIVVRVVAAGIVSDGGIVCHLLPMQNGGEIRFKPALLSFV
jgi:hypothetical protein